MKKHQPVNVNEVHKSELASAGFNQSLALTITKATNSMVCAYAFAALALLGFPALSLFMGPELAIYVAWFSQTFLQLTFLPVLSVGQGIMSRHQELQSEEQFNTTVKIYGDIEELKQEIAELRRENKEIKGLLIRIALEHEHNEKESV
jgi:hypothetical protein